RHRYCAEGQGRIVPVELTFNLPVINSGIEPAPRSTADQAPLDWIERTMGGRPCAERAGAAQAVSFSRCVAWHNQGELLRTERTCETDRLNAINDPAPQTLLAH